MSYAEELERKAPRIKALFDQAISTGSDQIDTTTIPSEHAVLLAKYLCEVAYDRPGLYPQLLRQFQVAGGIFHGSLQATIDRVDEMDADMAATFALEGLKKIVEFDRWIEGLFEQLDRQAEQRRSDGARGRDE